MVTSKRIMFDTNIYDNIVDQIHEINKTTDRIDYYITAIQIEEICKIPDSKENIEETRTRNFLRLVILRAKIVPTSIFILGYSRFDYACWSTPEAVQIYNKFVNPSGNNIKDAIIATTAVCEGCILVTEDKLLYNKMKVNNYEVMNLNEFKKFININ